MKRFAQMYAALDRTTSTNAKVSALATYFETANEPDRLWTIALLSGRRPRRGVTTTLLRQWAAEEAGIPLWLFEESYPIVGDLAETIAMVLPPPGKASDESLAFWISRTLALKDLTEADKRAEVVSAWRQLGTDERFLFNKLITGSFRVGVSQKLMTRALSRATGIEENILAHRLMGNWIPEATTWQQLLCCDNPEHDLSRPYPFYLAYPLETEPEALGPPADWIAERKWDGIRGQLILRGSRHFLWSRGEELITDRFPEFASLVGQLPNGTVIDGEVVAWGGRKPMPFQALQTRIGRKALTKRLLAETPALIIAYDLLEWQSEDVRTMPMVERRAILERLTSTIPAEAPLRLSPLVDFSSWCDLVEARDASRKHASEGLMLKRKGSAYQTGRRRGDWWKWKVDPLTIDAVMIYAQSGSGRRANLFTDFTFAACDENGELVPFAKAYSGLTDSEFREIATWVRRNTLERYGPVRRVHPEQVFELAFEGIQKSKRHKSGIALRFPRILRWRRDKKPADANTIADLHRLLATLGES
ncbi:MAG: putative ATP-dependent ligase YkoU [Pseudomonadota bacterium]|jgi:DNA ligase-1